jgi:hypothetical protein
VFAMVGGIGDGFATVLDLRSDDDAKRLKD